MINMESKYNSQLAEKVDEIRKICNILKIPCFMAFGVGEEDNGKYRLRGTCLLPELFGEKNHDRRFSDFVNVQNGFLTIPPETTRMQELDADIFALPEGFGAE